MSMPPRSRTGSGALVAGLIIALVVAVSVILLAASGATPTSVWNSFFPVHNEGGVTDRSTSVQNLYDIVFYIAVVIFFLVEGLIVWSAFRYRRKPTDTELPPQTHGNNLVEVIWTIVPTIIVVFLFALSWQTLNTVEAKVAVRRPRPGRRGPVPVVVRVPRRRRAGCQGPVHPAAPGRRRRRPRAPGRRARDHRPPLARTSSTPSTSPSSCSSGTSCRGRRTRSASPSRTPAHTAASAPSCAAPSTGRCCSTSTRSPKADFDTWLADQIAKANATPPPAPSGVGRPGAAMRAGAARTPRSPPSALTAPARAVHDPLQERRRGHPAQRRDQGRARARSRSRATSSPAPARSTTQSRRSPPARTPSSARSTRT